MLPSMRRRLPHLITATCVALVIAFPVALSGSSQAGAITDLTPSATVYPGIELWVDVGGGNYNGCTANFVFTNGTTQYIGMAAHCAGTGGDTDTACNSPVVPDGTPVFIGEPVLGVGSSGLELNAPETVGPEIGTMAYNSWVTMQADGDASDSSSAACQYNDLSLVQILPGLSVDPTVPVFGGPDGLSDIPASGSTVYSYQNSTLRLGLELLSPKVGISLGPTSGTDGWNTLVETVTPGIPGDSGSGFMDANGNAFGELSTITVGVSTSGLGVGNGVNSLAMELQFLNSTGLLGTVSLVPGATPFSGL